MECIKLNIIKKHSIIKFHFTIIQSFQLRDQKCCFVMTFLLQEQDSSFFDRNTQNTFVVEILVQIGPTPMCRRDTHTQSGIFLGTNRRRCPELRLHWAQWVVLLSGMGLGFLDLDHHKIQMWAPPEEFSPNPKSDPKNEGWPNGVGFEPIALCRWKVHK